MRKTAREWLEELKQETADAVNGPGSGSGDVNGTDLLSYRPCW